MPGQLIYSRTMRQILTRLFFVIILFHASLASAQEDKAVAKALYEKAAGMRKNANKYISKDPALADRLYAEANEVYPGEPDNSDGEWKYIDYLPRIRLERGDMRGANKAGQTALDRYAKMTMVYGVKGLSEGLKPVEPYIFLVLLNRASANLTYGDVKVAYADIEKIIQMGINEKNYKSKHTGWEGMIGTVSVRNVFQKAQYVAFLNNDGDIIQKMQPVLSQMGEKDMVATGDIYLSIIRKNYDKAIDLATAFLETGGNNRVNGRFLLAWTYALKGDTVKSAEYTRLVVKNLFITERMVARIRAVNAITQHQYNKALEYASEGLKPYRYLYLKFDQPGKSFYYGLRGDAYTGLKQYEKARAEYEKALLYNEGYDVAMQGLANIEVLVAKERKVDKTGPEIVITEPASARGLKVVAAGNDITVRGSANDPSGIKEVKANGQNLYFQPNGTFWGSIKLAEGNNKIEIEAVDMAGNSAQTFVEVEKKAEIKQDEQIVPVVKAEAKNYALIIAAQNYDDPNIPSLEHPVADAIKLKLVLKNKYSFADDNIYTLFNPAVNDFKKKFAELTDVIQPDDNLIIFYAGHGIWVNKEKKGYWLLTDALRNDVNTWLPNKTVLEMIAKIPSRHTLLITDACFSGSVFRTRGLGADAPPALREMSEKVSRVAITSGNDTEVPDESVFMKYLIKALYENKEKYLAAQKMFINQIIEAVMAETKTEPRYGTLELAGHIGGDYIFIHK